MAALQLIPVNRLDAWRMHRVGSGDTLATISKRYGVTPAAIVAANHLEASQVEEGDRLLIPAAARAEAPAKPAASSAASRRRSGTARKTTASVRPAPKRATLTTRASAN
jgi:LysM repeat protein